MIDLRMEDQDAVSRCEFCGNQYGRRGQRRRNQLPKWNDLTDAQKNTIADGIILPHPEERMQMAIEAYNAIRALIAGSTK